MRAPRSQRVDAEAGPGQVDAREGRETSTSTRSSCRSSSTVRSATAGDPGTAYSTSPCWVAAATRSATMAAYTSLDRRRPLVVGVEGHRVGHGHGRRVADGPQEAHRRGVDRRGRRRRQQLGSRRTEADDDDPRPGHAGGGAGPTGATGGHGIRGRRWASSPMERRSTVRRPMERRSTVRRPTVRRSTVRRPAARRARRKSSATARRRRRGGRGRRHAAVGGRGRRRDHGRLQRSQLP